MCIENFGFDLHIKIFIQAFRQCIFSIWSSLNHVHLLFATSEYGVSPKIE